MASYQRPERKIFEKLPFEVVDPKDEFPKVNIYGKDFVFVGPKKYFQSAAYKELGLGIYNFEARPDDVYLVGHGRSGTTLHGEMIWLIGNDLNYEEAAKNFIMYRFPHIDLFTFHSRERIKEISESKDATEEMVDISSKYLEMTSEGLAERKGRRFIKSHLPLSLMPPHMFEVGAKVIYCARNPKDMLVSLFHAFDFFLVKNLTDSFKDCFDDFNNDLTLNCPYFEHVKEAWERRNDKNFLFLFYEDTMKDKRQTIRKIADFLGKDLSENEIDKLEDYLSFEKFKNNKTVNHVHMTKIGMAEDVSKFIRRGKPGGWRELIDEEMEREFNRVMEEKLKGTDLKFPET
ncbi:estrogen sulfotransferase-like [Anoplophora glabripennis]|uniref:estrogen sulfotransferase-like n=1 Tax=Anoplophora glabripennis TaxID=217634 RepID=UPI000874FA02|nr:estrogen sulfotransferase-like [Anoplophora glabripennis]